MTKLAYVTGGMGGIGTAICQRLLMARRERPQPVVAGNFHMTLIFFGEVTVQRMEQIVAVAEGLVLAGLRRVVLLNGHGGNVAAAAIAGGEITVTFQEPGAVPASTSSTARSPRPSRIERRAAPPTVARSRIRPASGA